MGRALRSAFSRRNVNPGRMLPKTGAKALFYRYFDEKRERLTRLCPWQHRIKPGVRACRCVVAEGCRRVGGEGCPRRFFFCWCCWVPVCCWCFSTAGSGRCLKRWALRAPRPSPTPLSCGPLTPSSRKTRRTIPSLSPCRRGRTGKFRL